MKFLVFTLCVCAASAASFGNYGSKPYSQFPSRQVAKATAQVIATPVVAAEEVLINSGRNAYKGAQNVASAPFAAAKTVYKAAEYVTSAPVVAAKTGYKAPEYVASAPIVASRTVFNGNEAEAAVLRADNEVSAEGFNYVYETANGISSQVSGNLKNVDGANVLVSQGTYQYTAPDGTPVVLSFVADENGYQPRSDLLPVAPPVPEHVLRSIEYIRTHPQKEDKF